MLANDPRFLQRHSCSFMSFHVKNSKVIFDTLINNCIQVFGIGSLPWFGVAAVLDANQHPAIQSLRQFYLERPNDFWKEWELLRQASTSQCF